MILLTMLLIPILVALGFFLFSGKKITIGEFLLQNGIQILIMLPFAFGNGCSSMHDTEVWNGKVSKKERQEVSCSHSYQCNCYESCSSDSKGNQSCTTICQTCYEHSYDVDWNVYTTNGEEFDIDRVNRQGTDQPPRWTSVKVGEPTSLQHSYTNYIKASPDSLFRQQGLLEKFKAQIPKYPEPYDYYRMNHVVTANGAVLADESNLNKKLAELNGEIGRQKQVNVMVLAVKDLPHDYFFALEQAWIGSKKNDFVLVVGIDVDGKPQWADVLAWTQNKMAEVVARDAAMKLTSINDTDGLVNILQSSVSEYYMRKPMKDFEYLKNAMTPTFGTWVAAMIIGLISSIGLGIFFLTNDYDQDDEFAEVHNINNRRY